MPSRLKYEYIKEAVELEGYELTTKGYKNSRQKLDYVCPKGHKHSIKWNHWKSGHRCPYCDGQNKPLFSIIKASFEKEGYTLLTTEYINSKQKLEYVCPVGHKHSIDWSHWKNRNHRCPICYHLKMRASGHWNWRGGITPENVLLRFSDQYIWWRKSIFKRDNYTCQICGKKGNSLHAHHIFRFSIFRLRRYKLWNGITLCEKCHKAIKGKENKFMPKFLFLNLKKCKNSKYYKL